MPKMNLRRVFVVDDADGNPHGFGPGEADVPKWALDALAAQGTDIESLKVPEVKKAAPMAPAGAAPAST